MKRRGVFLVVGFASLALARGSAWADTKVYAGAGCRSNRTTESTHGGALLSTDSSASNGKTSKFICPLIRDNNQSTPFQITLRINFQNATFSNDSEAWLGCTLRVVAHNGTAVATESAILPGRDNQNDPKFEQKTITLTVPIPNASYSLRCNVPDTFSSDRSGIVSYELTE